MGVILVSANATFLHYSGGATHPAKTFGESELLADSHNA